MPTFALTIFVGAFLLFQVQPLIGKYILPWFGGSPGVWTTCMLFFQLLLLGGYVYAHLVSRRLPPRTQAAVHLVLLVVALAMLPITPADSWKPTAGGEPTWQILVLLTASLGLPYLVLATTGPLMQDWFRRTAPGASPYRLYALSNVGSLLALVSYPFYFETSFTRQEQARLWSWGLVVYAICGGFCAWRVWRHSRPVASPEEAPEPGATPPSRTHWLLWLLLPAVASILLLAVTNKMCQDVAVIPFLWVVPLALYLVTFIISFDSPRWYSRFYYILVLAGALVAACYALFEGADLDIVWQVAIYSAMLFAGCMVCHGELYRLRPHPRHLTAFYLMIAAGGAAGGLFVALVAPAIFDNFYELHLALGLIVVLLLAIALRDPAGLTPLQWRWLAVLLGLAAIYGAQQAMASWEVWLRPGGWPGAATRGGMARWHWAVWLLAALGGGALLWREWRRGRPFNWHLATCGLIGLGLIGLVGALGVQIRNSVRGAVLSARNFYGVLSVFEYERGNPDLHYLLLQHGRITHGLQFAEPARASMITSYFGPTSGLGLALRQFPRQEGQRVGLLGLGVGTVAGYGKPGDTYRIYEINPQVTAIARSPFSYLARSQAKIEIVMGDARLSMENEPPQHFDFLIMDAFSSDAVPVHLLTKEAFEIYRRHLKPDGAILVNISNRYLNLRPVVENAARQFGFQAYNIDSNDGGSDEEEGGWWFYAASWMVLSKNREFMNRDPLRLAASPPEPPRHDIPLWTDDYTSMFKILK